MKIKTMQDNDSKINKKRNIKLIRPFSLLKFIFSLEKSSKINKLSLVPLNPIRFYSLSKVIINYFIKVSPKIKNGKFIFVGKYEIAGKHISSSFSI